MANAAQHNSNDTSSFFGGGIPAVKFDKHGDKVTGEVIEKEMRQQTDFDSGKPLYWQDGSPRMQVVVTLQVPVEDEDDEGLRNLYVRGLMTNAVRDALRAVKQRDLNIGDSLTVEYTGDGKPARKGVSGAKQYKALIETA